MAKNKNTATTNTEAQHPPEAADFDGDPAVDDDGDEVIGHVSLPTLKHGEEKTVRIRVTAPMEERTKVERVKSKDPLTGKDVETEVVGTITVMKVIDLNTGKPAQYVPGTILQKELKDYRGGNQAYVGLCFKLTKHKAEEGKRAKRCTVVEIRDPEHKAG